MHRNFLLLHLRKTELIETVTPLLTFSAPARFPLPTKCGMERICGTYQNGGNLQINIYLFIMKFVLKVQYKDTV